MNFNELLEEYQAILIENNNLKEEIRRLKTQLGINEPSAVCDVIDVHNSENKILDQESDSQVSASDINNKSNSI